MYRVGVKSTSNGQIVYYPIVYPFLVGARAQKNMFFKTLPKHLEYNPNLL